MNEDAGLLETFIVPLVGVNFRPAETREIVKQLVPGQRLFLEREPSNEYDPNAVRVKDDDGNFLGFIAKANNFEIAMHLDEDKPYSVSVVSFLSVIKPNLEVKLYDIFEEDDEEE